MGLINDTVEYFRNNETIPKIVEGSKGDYIYYIAIVLNAMGYTCDPERVRNKSIEIAIRNLQHDIDVLENGNITVKDSKEYKVIRDFALNNLEFI